MGIFNRISRLVRGNANAAIDKLQDPAKEVEQLVAEMEQALRNARLETQKGMAAEKLAAARILTAEKTAATWTEKAEAAVRAGDDELARAALERKAHADADVAQAKREHAEAKATSVAQQEGLRRLDFRLREVKQRKGTIQAKLAAGRSQGLQSDALDEFERMAGRIDTDADVADAHAEVQAALEPGAGDAAAKADVNARLEKLGGGDLDDRLAALKKRLEGH